MTPEMVLTICKAGLEVALVMTGVILLPALAVGLLVSMFQAATQINEQTLSFIPKLAVTFIVLIVAGPWLLSLIMNYTQRIINDIPMVIG